MPAVKKTKTLIVSENFVGVAEEEASWLPFGPKPLPTWEIYSMAEAMRPGVNLLWKNLSEEDCMAMIDAMEKYLARVGPPPVKVVA